MRKILTLLSVACITIGGLILSAIPASASYACDGHWITASWGRGCQNPPGYVGLGQTQDILTDGYCVDAKYYNPSNGTWNHITSSTNCGGGVSSWDTNDQLCIRVYRGDGRYFTIRRDASYCP